ncbi:MAG TPA: hypothetical protein VD969_24730 [Symbiobacteriaceae bacterium]|nr:hypothetical protein [Symbiobacteriaceae bacterium]
MSASRAEAAIAAWVRLATQNSESTTVILGKFTGATSPTSYQNVAKAVQATYFQLSDEAWNAVAKAGATWTVNQAFLQQQMSQGKTFVLTSDPATAIGAFLNEVNWLIGQGYQFINSGPFWTAVK